MTNITTEEVREAYQEGGEGLDFKRVFNARGAEFDEWLAFQKRVATHDMPADLYNRITDALLKSGELYLAESVRSWYGASTRRALGLSPHGDGTLEMKVVDMAEIEERYEQIVNEPSIHRGES